MQERRTPGSFALIMFEFGSRNVALLDTLLIYRSKLQCWAAVDLRTRASHNNRAKL